MDTNIWLERILDQAKSEEVGQFLNRTPIERLFITNFAFHSIGVILTKLNRSDAFLTFVNDVFLDGNPVGTVAPMDRLKPRTIRLIGRLHAWLWKLTGGRLGNAFGRGPFMMLITKGRITGRERRTPVLYCQDQADLIVVASFGGNDMHPAWYLNLESCPEAEVILDGERRRFLASRVSAEEKGLIWPRLIAMYPNFAIYQQRTRREIPLLRLSDRMDRAS